ncbi:MAG: hypothetical protein IOD12_04730 [Silvanigrellales bacterium]|nr:hypothetical protein [Silvanigrellales bacterium]
MKFSHKLWRAAMASLLVGAPAQASFGTASTKQRYGGDAAGARDLKSLSVQLNLGVRYAVNAPKNTPLNRPLMNAVKASDDRFGACYSRVLDEHAPRAITTLAFRVKLDGTQGRFTVLKRMPGSKGNNALARCVGQVLKRIVVPVQKSLQADLRIQFAHTYERKFVAYAR